jgi:hypothetical protein
MKSAGRGKSFLLQIASGLIIVGLVTEIASLLWIRFFSFELFVFASVPLIGLGVLAFLVWFGLSMRASRPSGAQGQTTAGNVGRSPTSVDATLLKPKDTDGTVR